MCSVLVAECRATHRTAPARDGHVFQAGPAIRQRGEAPCAPPRWRPAPWMPVAAVRGECHHAVVFLRIEDTMRAPMRSSHERRSGRRRGQLGRFVRRQRPGASAKQTGVRFRRPRFSLPAMGGRPETGSGRCLPRQVDDFALGAAGVGDQGFGRTRRSRCRIVSRCGRWSGEKHQIGLGNSFGSGAPRSMAPMAIASAMAGAELTPVIAPSNPAWRSASRRTTQSGRCRRWLRFHGKSLEKTILATDEHG